MLFTQQNLGRSYGNEPGWNRYLSCKNDFLDSGAGAVGTTLAYGTGAVTYTRATAAAAKLSTGLWKLDVASGVARSHYTGNGTASGSFAGYLSETAATQLALNPRDMTQAAWVKITMTNAQTSTGIDGVANACTRLTAAGANSTILQTVVAAASSRTYSCFIKRITGTGTINITQDGGVGWTDITSQINSDTFTLVQLNASVLNAAFGLRIVTDTDAIDVDCNQFEAGAAATTPIPSGGTRNADVCTYPFSGNADETVGACSLQCFSPPVAALAVARIIAAFGAGSTGLMRMTASDVLTTVRMNDSTNVVTKSGLANISSAIRKRACAWSGTSMSLTGDGVAVSSGTFDGNMGTTSIAVGCNTSGTTAFTGCIKSFNIFSTRALSDAQLQAITTG